MSSRLFTASLVLLVSSSAFAFTDSVWVVGAQGIPGYRVDVEVWLQYQGAGPGDSLYSFDIPLTYNAAICTVEAITLGPDFSLWRDWSKIDNQGTQGPPAVPKVSVGGFTFWPMFCNPPPVSTGTHLAATLDVRILDTVLPPDSTCLDTLMQGFTPTIYLGFVGEDNYTGYIPSFSGDCVRVVDYSCGDCNADARVTIADALYLRNYIYKGGPPPVGEADVNVDGRITLADALYTKNYYYQTPPGSPEPCNPP